MGSPIRYESESILIHINRPRGGTGRFEINVYDYGAREIKCFKFDKPGRLRTGLDVGDYIRDRIKKLERVR